ncbi:hypothetical protein [Candidatus Pelagibacter sp. HIMB1709]|uniref:hypothetical protein n=1 Tax=Candidatus Pelagibacter sp. HIMB1709 TaxID=3413367 RepID=UPI003F8446F6
MLTKRTINNIEKSMPARDGVSLAKDIKDIEFDVLENLTDKIKGDFENDKKEGEDIFQWLERQPDEYFKRLKLSNGGVVDLAKYRKSKEPKIKKLNLAQGDYDRAVVDVQSQSDRDLIKKLLKMSGINIGGSDE